MKVLIGTNEQKKKKEKLKKNHKSIYSSYIFLPYICPKTLNLAYTEK